MDNDSMLDLRGRLEAALRTMIDGDDATVSAVIASDDLIKVVRYKTAVERYRAGMKQLEGVLMDWPDRQGQS